METAKGIVKVLKKDKKGIQLTDDQWYSNNFKPEVTCQVGDEVEITYKTNGNYKNYETIKVLNQTDTPVSKVSKGFDATTMLVSYAKDLTIANGKPLKDNAKEVLITYATIKNCLSDPMVLVQLLVQEEPIVEPTKEK